MIILHIDDEEEARTLVAQVVRRVAPTATLLAAASAVEGLEIVQRHRDAIVLVILDVRMPEADGRATALAIQAVHPTRPIPILPYSGASDANDFFDELRTLRPVHKLDGPAALGAAIEHALGGESTPIPQGGLVAYARDAALQQLVAVRNAQAPRTPVIFIATTFAGREMLRRALAEVHAQIILTCESGTAVQALRSTMGAQVLVADASDRTVASEAARRVGLPLLLIALRPEEAKAGPHVAGMLLWDKPEASSELRQALATVAGGGTYRATVRTTAVPPPPAPPPGLSPQQWAIVWYDLHGLKEDQVAELLVVGTNTIDGYQRRVRQRLGMTWAEVRAWGREQIAAQTKS